ncbi:MAG TPA: hypothetical protein VKW09_07715 [bacterium]|nr:hypothetical protein [bacterium]
MSRRKLTFWALMVTATLALSEFLAAWRVWRGAPSPDHGAAVVIFGLVLVTAVAWLGFLLYEVDRAAGRIRHEVALYEWVIARRRPEVPRKTAGAGR